jgi:hypothetical protein
LGWWIRIEADALRCWTCLWWFIIIHHDSSWFMYWTWLSSSLVLTSRVTWNHLARLCFRILEWTAESLWGGLCADTGLLGGHHLLEFRWSDSQRCQPRQRWHTLGWSDATKGYDETRLHYIWMSVLYCFWFLI